MSKAPQNYNEGNNMILSSAGRKTRIKSGPRKRRFSSSSFHNANDKEEPFKVNSNNIWNREEQI